MASLVYMLLVGACVTIAARGILLNGSAARENDPLLITQDPAAAVIIGIVVRAWCRMAVSVIQLNQAVLGVIAVGVGFDPPAAGEAVAPGIVTGKGKKGPFVMF